MKKYILYLMLLVSIFFLVKFMGFFSPKKVVIDNNISITTPKFHYLKLSILEFNKLDLSCYTDINCVRRVVLSSEKSVSSFSLVYKNLSNNILRVSISKYTRDSKEIMEKGFGKVNIIRNECRIKVLQKDSSICHHCIEYQILKENYHIDMTSNQKKLLNEKVDEICD